MYIGLDMGSGLIDSAAITPVNVSDQSRCEWICPRQIQMIVGDQSYCLNPAQIAFKKWVATPAAILKI